ncbi:hypothetical protein D3C84_634940 [compost metagenome]
MGFLFAVRPRLVCLALLAVPAGVWAELADPLDAEAATPALDYQSPLSAYQGLADEPPQDWREANELVGRIGGWRTYAQEPWEQPAAADAPNEPSQHGEH